MKRAYGEFFAGAIGGLAFAWFLALMALAAIVEG